MTGDILQIGFGAFGATHLRAWQALGLAGRVIVADPVPQARQAAASLVPACRQVADYRDALPGCLAVDIVAPTDAHAALACAALAAGKPVFIEKPVVSSAAQARAVLKQACAAGQPVMAGYYFRFHPKSAELQRQIAAGDLGNLRLLSGRFMGFKRSRADAGVLHNDAVHFLDLFCWLVGSLPERIFAVARDHFGRGLDDLALIVLEWRDGPVAQVEAGYVQPGKWPDAVVPGAITSKEIAVSGSRGAIEIDYAAESYVQHRVTHENRDGAWTPRFAGPAAHRNVAAADAVSVLTAELSAFLRRMETKQQPAGFAADGLDGGLNMALLLEAIETSSRDKRVVSLQG
ncbi:MAG: Gfo/Idh/MocA family protein [Reyranellaceae bacterium]